MYRQVLALFMVIWMLASCAVNPVTGKNELSFISEARELSIGREQYFPSQQSQGGLYQVDPALTDYVSEVGQRIARVSDRQLPYEFVVLNNSIPNAWALPGGKIAVNRGLLLKLSNEAELAAVLSHEIVHAAARHGAKSMQRGTILQGAILATSLGASDSELENTIVGGAKLGAQLLTQRYGRTAELEADYYGIQYMAEAGYKPEAAISLQETFVGLSDGKDPGWLEGLFSTHPPSQERVDKNRARVAALSPRLRADLDLGRDRYQQQIAYIKQKQGAYAAFDQANTLAAGNELDSALGLVNKAISDEPAEPRFYGLKADIYYEKKQYQTANSHYDQALKLDSDYFEYYLGRGLSRSKLGQHSAARQDLNRSNELLPTAIAMNALGELSILAGNSHEAKNYFQTAMNAGGSAGQKARLAFVRLDLPDNPARYLEAEAYLADGALVARITNRSGVRVARLVVTFVATANTQDIRRTVTIGPLAAGQRLQAVSGFRFSQSDVVENLQARVTGARL